MDNLCGGHFVFSKSYILFATRHDGPSVYLFIYLFIFYDQDWDKNKKGESG
jgi:hypothetical protein